MSPAFSRPGDEALPAITFLAAVPFHFQLQTRTQWLATCLAERGCEVRFVAAPTPRAMLRHWIAPWRDRRAGRIDLVWPMPMPPLRLQSVLGLTSWLGRRQAGWLRGQLGATRRHVLCVTTPVWWPVIERLRADVVIYDCLDDPAVHARPSSREIFAEWHTALCRRADLVIAVSDYLGEQIARLDNARVVVCGNGVDAEHFSPGEKVLREDEVGSGLASWFAWRRAHADAQVAGFVGSIDRWVDTRLVADAARQLPEVQFVIAGPARTPELVEPLRGLPNVHLTGWVPYTQVPTLVETFDVGLIPFEDGEIARCADPLKVYEYAAMGRPVISSAQFALDDPEAPLTIAMSVEAFCAAIREALSSDMDDAQAARRAFALRHTWQARAEEFLGAICAAGECSQTL